METADQKTLASPARAEDPGTGRDEPVPSGFGDSEQIVRLESSVLEIEAREGQLRAKLANVLATLAEIAHQVGCGCPDRAQETPALQQQKEQLLIAIEQQQQELQKTRKELERMRASVDRAKLERIFSQMEARRGRCVQLARELALEMGQLFAKDQPAAGRLASLDLRSLERLHFNALTRPITLAGDNNDGWMDRHKDVILDYFYVVKVHPMRPL